MQLISFEGFYDFLIFSQSLGDEEAEMYMRTMMDEANLVIQVIVNWLMKIYMIIADVQYPNGGWCQPNHAGIAVN